MIQPFPKTCFQFLEVSDCGLRSQYLNGQFFYYVQVKWVIFLKDDLGSLQTVSLWILFFQLSLAPSCSEHLYYTLPRMSVISLLPFQSLTMFYSFLIQTVKTLKTISWLFNNFLASNWHNTLHILLNIAKYEKEELFPSPAPYNLLKWNKKPFLLLHYF